MPLRLSSVLLPPSSFLIHHSTFLIPHSSFLIPHSSFLLLLQAAEVNDTTLFDTPVRGVAVSTAGSAGVLFVDTVKGGVVLKAVISPVAEVRSITSVFAYLNKPINTSKQPINTYK